MFTEVLKIIPKLDGAALNAMERSLSSRFVKIAKGFGRGVINSLKGGGYVAIATALINKVLNPLQHVQEVIDKTLNEGSDLATFADQFNTSAGSLARLFALGKANGLDPEGVRNLLIKFQGAVTEAQANPNELTAVSKFVGKKDIAEAFFEFIQSRQKLTSVQKNFVDREVFGERVIGKSSQFLNADHRKQLERLGGPTAEELTNAAQYANKAQDTLQLFEARRGLKDLVENSKRITPNAIKSIAHREDLKSEADTRQLTQFERLERLQIAGERIMNRMEQGFTKLAPKLAPMLEALPGLMDRLGGVLTAVEKSRMIRGLIPGQGKDK